MSIASRFNEENIKLKNEIAILNWFTSDLQTPLCVVWVLVRFIISNIENILLSITKTARSWTYSFVRADFATNLFILKNLNFRALSSASFWLANLFVWADNNFFMINSRIQSHITSKSMFLIFLKWTTLIFFLYSKKYFIMLVHVFVKKHQLIIVLNYFIWMHLLQYSIKWKYIKWNI